MWQTLSDLSNPLPAERWERPYYGKNKPPRFELPCLSIRLSEGGKSGYERGLCIPTTIDPDPAPGDCGSKAEKENSHPDRSGQIRMIWKLTLTSIYLKQKVAVEIIFITQIFSCELNHLDHLNHEIVPLEQSTISNISRIGKETPSSLLLLFSMLLLHLLTKN